MERHLSAGVATIVALMAACRTASGRGDIPFNPVEDADFLAEHVAPRDQVGDWLLSLARRRALRGKSQLTKARLAVSAGAQPRHWAGLLWPWHPPCDGPGAGPRLRVVGDPWESSAQLDSGRQLSLLIKHSTDRGGISLGNDEHPNSMAVRTAADKRVAAGNWVRPSVFLTGLFRYRTGKSKTA